MYIAFIFSCTELTSAMPHGGGLLAGMATLIEFVFAPPAIALAIGVYLKVQFPRLGPKTAAVCAYIVFVGLNILGVQIAATFELVVTVLAVLELLVFMGVVAPGFTFSAFALNGWTGSEQFGGAAVSGIFAAIPMAWFNPIIGVVFVEFMAAGYAYFLTTKQQRADAPADALLESAA